MRPIARLALVCALLSQPLLYAFANNGSVDSRSPASTLLADLTPAERVGQLFIVSFHGASADPGSDIYKLITESHIGGVVLLASQDNFADESNLPAQILTLTNQLQNTALGNSPPTPTPPPTSPPTVAPPITPTLSPSASAPTGGGGEDTPTPAPTVPAGTIAPQPVAFRRQATQAASATPSGEPVLAKPPLTPVPLFIAVAHEGGGSPFTQIRSGLTELPDPMAIGATWDPKQAEAIGEIAGKELAAMGVNLLLGPSLDVLFNPRPEASGDLGTRAFGGDPYWVGQMGAAYIRGVHAGSSRSDPDGRPQVMVVAEHFPGLGSSDRPSEEEIATVLKSLEQLKQIELAPFFSVTGRAATPSSAADALLISHIRYQGFQGNIRQTTRPISLDPQAFAQLFALPEFAAWHQGGGLVVSDSLGVRAIKRFYDSTEKIFPARKIALDAFLAGNDLLLLTDFGLNPATDQTAQIQDVIASFAQKYQDDPAFAERVDAAATRILARKMQLYGTTFSSARVLRDPAGLAAVGQGSAAVFGVAQNAVTLISPSQTELTARLPEPPARGDRIVIFTDTREARQCSTCAPRPDLAVDALRQDILRLYGPGGGNQVRAGDIQSFSFADLETFLKSAGSAPQPGGTAEPSPVEAALGQAKWIIFAMLNVETALPSSRALKDFLAAKPDAARTQKVIGFAFDAPYYLDTTEISKLTAYYALYSRAGVFHEVAARVLFRELSPSGASPVSVDGVAYDLIEQTAPDPNQVIEISIVEQPMESGATPTPQRIGVGETLFLRTGIIRDRNGHAVPDGTIVRFVAQYPADGLSVPIPDTPTADGVAHASFVPPRPGQIDIRAESEPALTSITLRIKIEGETIIVVTIQPTPPPTVTAAPTSTTTDVTPTPAASPVPTTQPRSDERGTTLLDFFSLLLSLVVFGAIGMNAGHSRREGVRLALIAGLGALIGYNYFALNLPGASAVAKAVPYWGATIVTWGGALAGYGVGWLRYGQTTSRTRSP
ncbi:MAG: glycoside hydrolase family 3 protein [Chloroflexi bacterium]|nr:glycoside hydrolase family 3 protein [Chloroflexota bacterium]